MKITYLIVSILFGISIACFGQHDKNWLFGIKESNQKTIVMKLNPSSIIFDTLDVQIPFESTIASISDTAGNLLFFSNGCEIFNNQGKTIKNGNNINPGEMHDWVCSKIGYNAPKGMTFLPFPNNPNQYFIIHTGMRYTPTQSLTQGPLYFSLLNGDGDNGSGELISKNNILTNAQVEPFSVAKHGNGRDWWIICPENNSNKYHLWLLNPNGISEISIQEVGPDMNCKSIGSTAFSPNGTRFGRHQNCETAVFKFDRCSGLLMYEQSFYQPNYLFGGGGIAFSPEGDRLFTTGQLTILQADLTKSNPTLDTALIWNTQWGVSLGLMQYSPFSEILIGGMSRTPYFSLISKPAFGGNSLGFQPTGINLPYFHARSVPNFPNFLLNELKGSICDTLGINSVSNLHEQLTFNVFPNPTSNFLIFEVKKEKDARFLYKITNQLGQIIQSGDSFFNQKKTIELKDFQQGLYFLQLYSEENLFLKTEKFSVLKE
jgi:hypothetical protein